MYFWITWMLLNIFNNVVALQTYQEIPCVTFDGGPGTCIHIKRCSELIDIMNDKTTPRIAIIELARSVRCREDSDSYVCCPVGGSTQGYRSTRPQTEDDTPRICGKTVVNKFDLNSNSDLIFDGDKAEPGSWPWLALLGLSTFRSFHWMCSGSLITDQWVLTTAHCLYNYEKKESRKINIVRLGGSELDSIHNMKVPIDIAVMTEIYHHNYKLLGTDNIGMVRLKSPVQFSKMIQPICLPKLPLMANLSFENHLVFVAAWGNFSANDTSLGLREAIIPVLENKHCQDLHFPLEHIIINNNMCTGYLQNKEVTCMGDEGGPVMLPYGNSFYVIGINSFNRGCDLYGKPMMKTRITPYVQWIVSKIGAYRKFTHPNVLPFI